MSTDTHEPPFRPARVAALALPLILCLALPSGARATERVLSDTQWRADLDQTLAALIEIHPEPFHSVERAELEAAATRLHEAIPELSDREIVVRLSEVVALLRDGHTRLFLPRQHHDLAPALEAGHSGTEPPRHEALALAQLPVRFGLFADGLFITHAVADHQDLVGLRVMRIGGTPIEEALEAAARTIAAGNDSRTRLLVPDRLALPDVLAAVGITTASESTELALAASDGERRVTLGPLGAGAVEWHGGPAAIPLWLRDPDSTAWYEILPERSAVYVQVNELEAFPELPWADFVRRTLAAAREAGVERYVLDLRHNAGGNGMWTTPFVNGLASSELDRYGRLMVLIGGHTFSAAQMLVNQLERFTDVCFVGEPSGSPPTHYGDSKKVILEASGLTLRVSTLFWPSWLAADFRKATPAHVDAEPGAADYFAARDPVLETALTYEPPDGIARQVEDLLRRGKVQAAILRFVRNLSDPRVASRSVEAMVAAGHRLLDDGLVRPGRIVFILVGDYHPSSAAAQAGLGRSLELAGEPEEARRHYEKALELDAENHDAREALERLTSRGG